MYRITRSSRILPGNAITLNVTTRSAYEQYFFMCTETAQNILVLWTDAVLSFINLTQKYKANSLMILMKFTEKSNHSSFCMKPHHARKDHAFQISFNSASFLKRQDYFHSSYQLKVGRREIFLYHKIQARDCR